MLALWEVPLLAGVLLLRAGNCSWDRFELRDGWDETPPDSLLSGPSPWLHAIASIPAAASIANMVANRIALWFRIVPSCFVAFPFIGNLYGYGSPLDSIKIGDNCLAGRDPDLWRGDKMPAS